jgi:hypothetical protein
MEKIEDFLKVDEFPKGSGDGDGYGYGDGSGSGSGYGDGSGDGEGSGSGYGYGDGSGSGDGYGYGDGSGDGYGDGIEEYNNQKVYKIDGVPTLVDSIKGNYAKGRIIKSDLTTEDCYIAKCGNYFAHGKTIKQALSDATEKYNERKPLEERIADFNNKFPEDDIPYEGSELFSWHHILTGSCLFGRQQFCQDRGLNVNKKYTIKQFIELTENSFGSSAIKKLKECRSNK